jgi:hypothetical protein
MSATAIFQQQSVKWPGGGSLAEVKDRGIQILGGLASSLIGSPWDINDQALRSKTARYEMHL